MIQLWFEKHRELQRRRAEEGFDGFTLIELLIVIVVLGILAATVIFALGGITSNSAQSACNTDAKSVETAVDAFKASPDNPSNAYPTTIAQLTGGTGALTNGNGNADVFLQIAPNNTHYAISLGVDAGTGAGTGAVIVDPHSATHAASAYDVAGAPNPCSFVS